MPRGRPRQFDEDAALTAAMLQFWEAGFSATSLDDLASAMQMSRPSIYHAFGDKEALYRKALARFSAQLDAGLEQTLETIPALRPGLVAFFDQAIDVYTIGDSSKGCLMICTAPAEALGHPEVGADLEGLVERLDDAFYRRLRRAVHEGEISKDTLPKLTAQLLQATLHTLALRARSGASRPALRKLARHAVARLVDG